MGQCVSCQHKKVKPDDQDSALDNKLIAIRASIFSSIRSLHLICLDCSDGIERSIIQKERDVAVLLRLKYLIIKEKSKILQETIKSIDDIHPTDRSTRKKDLISQSDLILESLNSVMYSKDVERILEKDKSYFELVMKEVEKLQVNENDAESFVDEGFRERGNSPRRTNRRRYSRRLTNL